MTRSLSINSAGRARRVTLGMLGQRLDCRHRCAQCGACLQFWFERHMLDESRKQMMAGGDHMRRIKGGYHRRGLSSATGVPLH